MDHLRIKATKWKYQEHDQRLKDKLMNGINDKTMTLGIIQGITAIKNKSEVTSEQVLVWVRRIEV